MVRNRPLPLPTRLLLSLFLMMLAALAASPARAEDGTNRAEPGPLKVFEATTDGLDGDGLAFAAIPEGAALRFDASGKPVMVGPAPAPLASCSGTGCNGKDPQTTGCGNGATTLASKDIYAYGTEYYVVGKLELRYSPTCKTKWSRVTRYNSNPAYPYARVHLQKSGSSTSSYYRAGSTTYQFWSLQVYAPSTAWRACGSLALSSSANYYTSCTSYK